MMIWRLLASVAALQVAHQRRRVSHFAADPTSPARARPWRFGWRANIILATAEGCGSFTHCQVEYPDTKLVMYFELR